MPEVNSKEPVSLSAVDKTSKTAGPDDRMDEGENKWGQNKNPYRFFITASPNPRAERERAQGTTLLCQKRYFAKANIKKCVHMYVLTTTSTCA